MVCNNSALGCTGAYGAAHDLSKYCCSRLTAPKDCVCEVGVVLGVHSSQFIALELTYT